jgi:pimeloyl-ACP methyl ester carboxylesterase
MSHQETALTFLDPHGHAVAGVLAAPDSGGHRAVVLCHGFLSNKSSATNKALTAMLLPHNIATFRFDFFGQGESEGRLEEISVGLAVDQALAALRLVSTKGYRHVGLVGSSFGGLVAILAAAGYGRSHPQQHSDFPPKLHCLALKCPVSDFPAMLRWEFGDAGMAAWRATNTIPNVMGGAGRIRLPFSFYEDCAQYVAYASASAVTIPTLIVHGDADECVPVAQSVRLQHLLGNTSSLVVLPGANHHFSDPPDFRAMVAHISGWLVDHLPISSLRASDTAK